MKPQNNDFSSYTYILYYQSNFHYHSTQNWAIFFLIFRINSYLMEVLEQPGGGTPAFNVVAIVPVNFLKISWREGGGGGGGARKWPFSMDLNGIKSQRSSSLGEIRLLGLGCIRTISLPDEVPFAHFCIGGHNPFRVFLQRGYNPHPRSFLQGGQNPFCEFSN